MHNVWCRVKFARYYAPPWSGGLVINWEFKSPFLLATWCLKQTDSGHAYSMLGRCFIYYIYILSMLLWVAETICTLLINWTVVTCTQTPAIGMRLTVYYSQQLIEWSSLGVITMHESTYYNKNNEFESTEHSSEATNEHLSYNNFTLYNWAGSL